MAENEKPSLVRFLDALARHLDNNESLYGSREQKFLEFEQEFEAWNTKFLGEIEGLEKLMEELEKKMEG